MKPKDYVIEFNKLNAGLNEFGFEIDENFLAGFEFSPVAKAQVKVQLKLFRSETMFDLKFRFTGTTKMECDTCTAEISLPLNAEFNLLIKLSETENTADDDIVYITKGEIEYDLKQYLYESFLLAIPNRHSCDGIPEPKPCNTDVLEKLKAKSVADKEANDPRWDKLKDIFKN